MVVLLLSQFVVGRLQTHDFRQGKIAKRDQEIRVGKHSHEKPATKIGRASIVSPEETQCLRKSWQRKQISP